MSALRTFIPITKVDAARRLVYGLATAETEDRAGEICDYASTKPLYFGNADDRRRRRSDAEGNFPGRCGCRPDSATRSGGLTWRVSRMSFESFQRHVIVREARSWVRTPYHAQADIKGAGVDCGMLLVRVFVDSGLVPPFDPRPYADDWYLHRSEERYLGFIFDRDEGSGRAVARRRDGFPLRTLLLARRHRDAG